MTPALTLTLDHASFGTAQVLGQLRLEVAQGETLAITGASGIGKSTLLRVLVGLHRDWRGELHLHPTQARLAVVFQEPTLLPWRTALQNITLTTAAGEEAALALLADVGLGALAQVFPNRLSLGQQRRLALARAFAMQPDVLLMDEAFTSLDAGLADEMMQLFEALRARKPLATVIVTHDRAEAKRLASRILHLEGRPACFAASPLAG